MVNAILGRHWVLPISTGRDPEVMRVAVMDFAKVTQKVQQIDVPK